MYKMRKIFVEQNRTVFCVGFVCASKFTQMVLPQHNTNETHDFDIVFQFTI